MDNIIKLDIWLKTNDIYALKNTEQAYRIRKQFEDRDYAEKSRQLAESIQNFEHWQNSGLDEFSASNE
jgi:hypothetical protein